MENLRERRYAIRRARRVGDDVVLFGVVHLVVHAEHDRDVRIRCRRRDHDLLRARVDVLLRAVAPGEEPRRFDHELDLEVAPGEVRRIALGKDLQLGLAGLDRGIADLDVLVQLPENGVVLEQVPHRLRVAEVVDRDELEVAAALEMRTEEIAPDPPESVDPHARLRHQSRV